MYLDLKKTDKPSSQTREWQGNICCNWKICDVVTRAVVH